MDKKYSIIRTYTCELIRACFEKRKPAPIPEGITTTELLDVVVKGQIQYPMACSLQKLELSEEDRKRVDSMLKVSTLKTFTQVMALSQITKAFE